jgi:drug/metabolite transporter (DMT)-like permease
MLGTRLRKARVYWLDWLDWVIEMSEHDKGLAFGIAAVLIWTGFILVSRMGGISELSAYDVIAIRYVTCASLVLPFWLFRYRFNLLSFRLFTTSLVGGLAYALFTFNGFQLAPASHAAVLLPGLMPFFIILLSVLLKAETIAPGRWLGVLLITFGVATLFALQLKPGGLFLIGDLYLVGGAFCWGLFSVLIKRWQISPWQVTVSLALFTCVAYLPVYIFFLPKKLSFGLWQDIAIQSFYQGFMATIVQMIFYVRAVQALGASTMGALMAIVPVLSGVAAIFIFDEDANVLIFMSFLMTSIGAMYAGGMSLRFKLVGQGVKSAMVGTGIVRKFSNIKGVK